MQRVRLAVNPVNPVGRPTFFFLTTPDRQSNSLLITGNDDNHHIACNQVWGRHQDTCCVCM
ncbi:hypothetical protein COCMIDRAFT_79563 [Bipolaris oryzae ATCC 44560]|uniref:Uncharacterized protein n=1 Tax=Bipolaris oryzae ATCC 44560 TaxID=930090 RepID=W6ZMH6_COCMI|nr:uncharacterized protein COCMIDRAFT_79563 [Bipolaris oryzae ATCC 44560]EUC51305.1 hypothetical protein COCMIDRAFT_79563 [Bipolaris oryzae ATCC 44560]